MRLRPRTAPRAPLALAAALLLAGCEVDVDGAPCAAVGEISDCPDAQACGNDLRCSARALACASSRCTPGESMCRDGATAVRCTARDAVCGRWEDDDCAGRAMVCGLSHACECPEYAGTTIVADPRVASRRGAPPFPTGQPEPPECRFGRLWDALAAASSLAPTAATVEIRGAAGAPVVFGAGTGEGWPLAVAANVVLLGAAAPAGPTTIRGAPGAARLVEVQGALEGVRVEGGGASGEGVALSCGASGTPSLDAVAVDGGAWLDPDGLFTAGLAAGVTVGGSCGARLAGVQVSAVAGPALTLALDPASAATADVLGGCFGESEVGIWIRGGKVSVRPDGATGTVVSANAEEGIVVGGIQPRLPPTGNATVDATLQGVTVLANGGTGLSIQSVLGTSRVRTTACDVAENGAARAAIYGPSGGKRTAGGVFVALGPIAAFGFAGNRVWANAGDQLAFFSDTGWSVAPAACGADSNVFACVAGGSSGVALLGAGTVQAARNVWPALPPHDWVTATVANADDFCAAGPGVPAKPACPAP